MQKLVEFAQNGSPEALAIIAQAYAAGDGLEQDTRQARRMIRESIRLRSNMGMYVKSKWLEQGMVFEKDLERAEEFLRRSADSGYDVAAYEVAARLFDAGPEHSEEALHYLNKAADNGYIPALYVRADG